MFHKNRPLTTILSFILIFGVLACGFAAPQTPASAPLPSQTTEASFTPTLTSTAVPTSTLTPLPTETMIPTNTPDPWTVSQLEQVQKILPITFWSTNGESGNTNEIEGELNTLVMQTHVFIPTTLTPWGGVDQVGIESEVVTFFWKTPTNLSKKDRYTIDEFVRSLQEFSLGGVFVIQDAGKPKTKDATAETDILLGIGILLRK